jgi:hypothetical protein
LSKRKEASWNSLNFLPLSQQGTLFSMIIKERLKFIKMKERSLMSSLKLGNSYM